MFYDQTAVSLTAGKGGQGALSFRRERFLPKGGPDGGDGGNGGDIVLECDENVGDLRQFHFKKQYKAGTGRDGEGRQKTGRSGNPVVLKLPPGVEIKSQASGEIVAELLQHGESIVLLRGGKGGKGNYGFRSATNQAPRQFTPGQEGEAGEFVFTLKTIADVGLVGFPNAGKSSLLGLLTEAHPRIAPYPFTTLNPTVGVLENTHTWQRLKIADIPGLIEGASENKGLGHRFLRHIERCRFLLFIIDIAGTDERLPWEDFFTLKKELAAYNSMLLSKPFQVVANKMDLPGAPENLRRFEQLTGLKPLTLSCADKTGLQILQDKLFEMLSQPPTPPETP